MVEASWRLNLNLVIKVFMSRESSLSETSSAAAFVASASAISASAKSIISRISFNLAIRPSCDSAVTSDVPATASVFDTEAEDVRGGGMVVVKGVDEVKRVERLFAGVVSDDVRWFSEVKLTAVGPKENLRLSE